MTVDERGCDVAVHHGLVVLTDEQAAELQAVVNSRDVPASVATRARIVLWRAEGRMRRTMRRPPRRATTCDRGAPPDRPGRRAGQERLRLDSLAPPAVTLDPAAVAALEGCAAMFIDPERAWPKTGLELATLGRLALLGDGDHIRAAIMTAVDYLAVASTVPGLVREDWPAYCARILDWEAQAGRSDVAELLEAYEAGRREQLAAARSRRIVREVEDDALTRRRAALVALLDESAATLDGRRICQWPTARRVEAGSLRAVLVKLRSDASNAKTAAALADVEERARPHLVDVDELHRAVGAEHQSVTVERERLALESRQAVEDRRRRQRDTKAIEAQRRAEQRAEEKAGRDMRRAIEAKLNRRCTRLDENVSGWLLERGIVAEVGVTVIREVAPRLGDRALHWVTGGTSPKPQGTTVCERVRACEDVTGRRWYHDQLATWESPATRAVLSAALNALGVP
jgi:hypothetical protein